MAADPGLPAHAFSDPALERQALTHRSFGRPDNERLEFLGDAVLQLLVSEALFAAFPKADEGELTRRRSALVREASLADFARRLGLGERLLLGPGELKSGGYRRDSILADAFEALLGAIHLDAGLAAARAFLAPLLGDVLVRPDDVGKDAKTLLQELLQGRGMATPQYQLVAAEGDDHAKVFTARCSVAALELAADGSGGSRRAAEMHAAQLCLTLVREKLDELRAKP